MLLSHHSKNVFLTNSCLQWVKQAGCCFSIMRLRGQLFSLFSCRQSACQRGERRSRPLSEGRLEKHLHTPGNREQSSASLSRYVYYTELYLVPGFHIYVAVLRCHSVHLDFTLCWHCHLAAKTETAAAHTQIFFLPQPLKHLTHETDSLFLDEIRWEFLPKTFTVWVWCQPINIEATFSRNWHFVHFGTATVESERNDTVINTNARFL